MLFQENDESDVILEGGDLSEKAFDKIEDFLVNLEGTYEENQLLREPHSKAA